MDGGYCVTRGVRCSTFAFERGGGGFWVVGPWLSDWFKRPQPSALCPSSCLCKGWVHSENWEVGGGGEGLSGLGSLTMLLRGGGVKGGDSIIWTLFYRPKKTRRQNGVGHSWERGQVWGSFYRNLLVAGCAKGVVTAEELRKGGGHL